MLRKVAELLRYAADVRARVQVEPERFEADEDLHDLAAFHLLLALQNAADLAFHLVADRGLSVPGSQREAYEALARQGTIDHDLATALGDAAGLPNRLAHQYGTVDWRRLLAEAPQHLQALERFARRVAEITQ